MNRSTTIAFLSLATMFTIVFVLWEHTVAPIQYVSPAASYASLRPGSFAIDSALVTCTSTIPLVSLSWSPSPRASNYLIQRMYPWGGGWESVGATSSASFVDRTYEPGYDIGDFLYRVQAINAYGTKNSQSKPASIFDCSATSTQAGVPTSTPVNVAPSPASPLPTQPAPAPTPVASTRFKAGDRVATTDIVNVRQSPSTTATILGTQALGRLGQVIGAAIFGSGLSWWNINFDSGSDGWTADTFLAPTTSPIAPVVAPTPTPTPTPVTPATPVPAPAPSPSPTLAPTPTPAPSPVATPAPAPSPSPVSASDTTPPSTPTNMLATGVGQTQVNLSWTASTDTTLVAGYKIYRCAGSTCTPTTQVATSTSSSFVNTAGISSGTTYRYRVAAFDPAGNVSAFSSIATATTIPAPTPSPTPVPPSDTIAPSVPTNLRVTGVSQTTVTLAWTASTDNVTVTGYKIFRCQGAGCVPTNQVGTSSVLSYQSMNLAVGTTQTYRIASYDASGNVSALTTSVATTTLSQTVAVTPPPPSPTLTPTPAPVPAPTPTPTPVPPATAREWGVFVPGGSANDLTTFETLVGKPADMRAVFIGWGHSDDFPTWLSGPLKSSGKTLLLYWQTAANYNSSIITQPGYNYDSIISGTWDSYIRSFAQSVKAYGGPVILLPFEEMNGDWYPWSGTLNGNTPAKHITAWRRMVDIFRSEGVTNVKFAWSPNSTSWPNTPANDLTQYYPGDAYVDYVGVDGFNFGNPWQSFSQVFDTAITKLKAYNKPIYIFSMASAEGQGKAAWITDALTVQIPKYPEIKGFIWFNENKEQNWLVNSSQSALDAFKSALGGY